MYASTCCDQARREPCMVPLHPLYSARVTCTFPPAPPLQFPRHLHSLPAPLLTMHSSPGVLSRLVCLGQHGCLSPEAAPARARSERTCVHGYTHMQTRTHTCAQTPPHERVLCIQDVVFKLMPLQTQKPDRAQVGLPSPARAGLTPARSSTASADSALHSLPPLPGRLPSYNHSPPPDKAREGAAG